MGLDAAFKRLAARGTYALTGTRLGQTAAAGLAGMGRVATAGARLARTPVDSIFTGAGKLVLRQGTRAADALGTSALGRLAQRANQRILSPLAQQSSRAGGFFNRAADATRDYLSLANHLGKGPVLTQVTGARTYQLAARGLAERRAAAKAYDAIRNSTDDVARIARNTGRTEAEIRQIKNHIFHEQHRLSRGVRRFDADPQIAAAWQRLQTGVRNADDLALLEHELAESMLMKAGMSQQAAHAAAAQQPAGVAGAQGAALQQASSVGGVGAVAPAQGGALVRFTEVTAPWQRKIYQRANIDWDLVRPPGVPLAGMTNRAAARFGYSPGRINPATGKWDQVVLHHTLDNPRGALVETWRSSHTRYHNAIGRDANDFNEFIGQTGSWRELRPDWVEAWNNEVHGYWAWRTGARPNTPVRSRLTLPGDTP
jgi:hypothetical protein